MSIHHSSDNAESNTPRQLYVLEMDSLHILNNSADYGHSRYFLPVQTKEGEDQDQLQVLIDACQEPTVKFVTLQVDRNCQQGQKQLLPNSLNPHLVSTSFEHTSLKQAPIDTSETELIPSSLVNTLYQGPGISCKKPLQNYVHISDRIVLPRALAVLPTILQIRRRDEISPRRTLLPRTRFGPIQGVKYKMSHSEASELMLTAVTNKTPIFVVKDEDEFIIHINVSDKDKSNWIGLLPLGDENSANVWIYEENKELYIITTESLPSRKQLMLGYSKKYAQDYGLLGPTKDIEIGSPLNKKSLWCHECQRAMLSPSQYQRHMEAHRQEEKLHTKRRRYRCRYCSRTFSRIFTLRRHVARHCEKRPVKSDNVVTTEPLPEVILNTALNSEENRVPSDESFQNYSNGLDFSTNLFDTDRMPGLDISGNSRSDSFYPYALVNEGPLTNDLGYTNGSTEKIENDIVDENEKTHQAKKTETSRVPCSYCNQNVAKGKKRQHLSECPARRFECECKKVFASKELLALHIYSEHSNENDAEETDKDKSNTTNDATPQDNKTYLCEQCQHAFKRRGMLVNHLWRVHKMVAARVPLEKRVRHYPCGACPKLYRTAAKRDRHLLLHHPGAEKVRPREIEGGTRSCSPAACPECPRQYATRAKLLQHQRQHHPHLVPTPPKKKSAHRSNTSSDRLNTSEEHLNTKTSFQQLLNFY